MGTSALQPWVTELTIMQQSVLLGSVRGPDGVGKYHPAKYMLRWYRRCILLSALDQRVLTTPIEPGGGSFTGPSVGEGTSLPLDWAGIMDPVVADYLRSLDELPHHFQMHFLHAAEILGYKHPDPLIRRWWRWLYDRLVNDLHLHPETEEEMDRRLGDDRAQWLERADSATVE